MTKKTTVHDFLVKPDEQADSTPADLPAETEREALVRRQVAEIHHQIEIDRLIDKAYAVIDSILSNFDKAPRLAYETARLVLMDAGAPIYSKHGEPVQFVNTQINLNQSDKAEQAIQTLIDSLTATTSQTAKNPLKPIGTPSPHIRISGE